MAPPEGRCYQPHFTDKETSSGRLSNLTETSKWIKGKSRLLTLEPQPKSRSWVEFEGSQDHAISEGVVQGQGAALGPTQKTSGFPPTPTEVKSGELRLRPCRIQKVKRKKEKLQENKRWKKSRKVKKERKEHKQERKEKRNGGFLSCPA